MGCPFMGDEAHTDEKHRVSCSRFAVTFRVVRSGVFLRTREVGTPLSSSGTVLAISVTEPRLKW